MTNYHDFLLGIFSAGIGSYWSFWLTKNAARKAHLKYRTALALIFHLCVTDCLRHIEIHGIYAEIRAWDFYLWNTSQVEIAKEYPEEFTKFVNILQILKTIDHATDLKIVQQELEELQSITKQLRNQ